MATPALVNTDGNDVWNARPMWNETRELPGNTTATVVAYVVPKSGVGWVDCEWRRGQITNVRDRVPSARKLPEAKRLLSDWSGESHPGIVRQVITLADEWFNYCFEQAEREVAVVALAGHASGAPPRDLSGSYPGPFSATGPAGPGVKGPTMADAAQHVRRQLAEMRKNHPVSSARLAAPEAGSEAVEGVLSGLTGQAVFGTPESPSDGLGDLGDYVAEPEVRG